MECFDGRPFARWLTRFMRGLPAGLDIQESGAIDHFLITNADDELVCELLFVGWSYRLTPHKPFKLYNTPVQEVSTGKWRTANEMD